MTLRQIVSDIENIASSGSLPVDFKIDSSQIAFWVNEVRSTLISQAIQKKQDLTDLWIQGITCLELEQVDASECCEITTDCYILKTVKQIPSTIETYNDNNIVRVTKPTGEIITRSNVFEAVYNKYNKYIMEQIADIVFQLMEIGEPQIIRVTVGDKDYKIIYRIGDLGKWEIIIKER